MGTRSTTEGEGLEAWPGDGARRAERPRVDGDVRGMAKMDRQNGPATSE